jgi:hypothetical protein
MLVAHINGMRIEAAIAVRGPDFFCPNCARPVTLKKGLIKVHHFAHKPPTTCTWASGETDAHLRGKQILKAGFIARGLLAEVEVPVLSAGGDRRADVLVRSPDGSRSVAVELQHQALDFAQIETRTRAYMSAGVPVIWVALLNKDTWGAAELFDGKWRVKRFSVRPWQRWAHTYGLGELWFLDVDMGMLWRGIMSASIIHVESSSWYNSDGSEESAGGYDKVSRKWRVLTLDGPYAPSAVLIDVMARKPYSTKYYSIPGGVMAKLKLPG